MVYSWGASGRRDARRRPSQSPPATPSGTRSRLVPDGAVAGPLAAGGDPVPGPAALLAAVGGRAADRPPGWTRVRPLLLFPTVVVVNAGAEGVLEVHVVGRAVADVGPRQSADGRAAAGSPGR